MSRFISVGLLVASLAYFCHGGVVSVQERSVSTSDETTILTAHNDYRKAVPSAAKMMLMYWDDDIAASAQSLADKCVWAHDVGFDRRKLADVGLDIGQNLAKGYSSWTAAIDGWHAEIVNFTYGVATTKKVGHFTQVVRDVSALIGCGFKDCTDIGKFYVCNYGIGNDMEEPYVKGDAKCTGCGTCVDNALCDCTGKMCKNGGSQNLLTCGCTCANGFTGDECETCPPFDMSTHCGTNYNTTDCVRYYTVPELCPIMCGICTSQCPGMTLNSCKNGGSLGTDCSCTCTSHWTGDTCETFTGDCDDDHSNCGSTWPSNYCGANGVEEFIEEYCPYMCGYCTPVP